MAQSARWRVKNHQKAQAHQVGKYPKEQMQKQKKLIKKSRYQRSRNGEYKRQNYGEEGSPSI